MKMDEDGKACKKAMDKCKCLEGKDCSTPNMMLVTRKLLTKLTGNQDDTFWVGEMGWSAPVSDNFKKAVTDLANCADTVSSYGMLYAYYKSFLQWDLSLPEPSY